MIKGFRIEETFRAEKPNLKEINLALYIILSGDMPLLKSDFFLRSEFLFGHSVGIFRAAEESNLRRYACKG